MNPLAQQIIERRKSLRLTAMAVAKAAGVTRSYLSMIENDKIDHPPSDAVLKRIEAVLKLKNSELVAAAAHTRTPLIVQQKIDALQAQADRGRALAQWIHKHTHDHGSTALTSPTFLRELKQRADDILYNPPDPPS